MSPLIWNPLPRLTLLSLHQRSGMESAEAGKIEIMYSKSLFSSLMRSICLVGTNIFKSFRKFRFLIISFNWQIIAFASEVQCDVLIYIYKVDWLNQVNYFICLSFLWWEIKYSLLAVLKYILLLSSYCRVISQIYLCWLKNLYCLAGIFLCSAYVPSFWFPLFYPLLLWVWLFVPTYMHLASSSY